MYQQGQPSQPRSRGAAAVGVQGVAPMRSGPPNVAAMSMPPTGTRFPELLEQMKMEFEAMIQQVNIAKLERDDFERKLTAQLQEMESLQQALKTLEANHRRIRQQYEEDLLRLRRQLEGQQPMPQQPPAKPTKRGHVDENEARVPRSGGRNAPPPRSVSPPRVLPTPDRPEEQNRPPPMPVGQPQRGGRYEEMPSNGKELNSKDREPEQPPVHKKPKTDDSQPEDRKRQASHDKEHPKGQPQQDESRPPPPPAEEESRAKVKWTIQYNTKPQAFPEGERPIVEMQHTLDHQSVVCCVRLSSDGKKMASGCHKTAQVFDVETGQQIFSVSRPPASSADGEDAYIRAVCFSPDGSHLIAGMPQNTIKVWDIASKKEVMTLVGHEMEIYSLDYVQNFIASGSGDRKVRLWDARNGNCHAVLGNDSSGPSEDGVTSVALSPDGRLLAAASLDKIVRVWDTTTLQQVDRLEGHTDSVYSIAFSPDGKNLISGSLDKTLMLWDITASGRPTSRPRLMFSGHKDYVLSVAYTPDGRWLMSGSKDRSVIFWDPRSTRSVLTMSGYRNSVISVASSPASPHFATGSGDCLACIWKYTCQSV